MTSVPVGPSAASRASITATGPPATQPRELRELCASTVCPSRRPIRRHSSTRLATVSGPGLAATTRASGIWSKQVIQAGTVVDTLPEVDREVGNRELSEYLEKGVAQATPDAGQGVAAGHGDARTVHVEAINQ